MARIQVYVSDEVAEKINAIVSKRRSEGGKEKDVSFSSISSMLVELGLRVYEAQMERKEDQFNQTEFNKIMLEAVLKTQYSCAKILGMSAISPHIKGDGRFEYGTMVSEIKENVAGVVTRFFPEEE